jgi:DNA modification methylase
VSKRQPTEAVHAKLKRNRRSVVDGPEAEEQAAGGSILTVRPTAERPALRRYVPAQHPDLPAELAAAGVLDWRGGAAPMGSVEEAADRVILGDSREVLARLPQGSVACVITSPPYWNAVDYGTAGQIGATSYEGYLAQLLEVWRECERVLIPNGKLCINTPILPIPKAVLSGAHTRHLKNLNNDIEATILGALSLQRLSLYVWQKQTTEKMFGSYPFPPNLFEQNTIEFINVYVKPGKPRVIPRAAKEPSRLTEAQWMDLTRQVWQLYPRDVQRRQHPAPFPEALPNRLIAMYTFAACPEHGLAGDVVLDPFCGIGATCVAARKLGRRFIGVDLEPDFALAAAQAVSEARFDGIVVVHRRRH